MEALKRGLRKLHVGRTRNETSGSSQEAESFAKLETIENKSQQAGSQSPEHIPRTHDQSVHSVEPIPEHDNSPHCSYCLEKLCPPTCATALFLDGRTGIFFPASLYPINDATAAPTTGFTNNTRLRKQFKGHGEPRGSVHHEPEYNNSADKETEPRPGLVYKTIWCEHHRCPPSLITENHKIKHPSLGSHRFFCDYNGPDWLKSPAKDRQPREYLPNTENGLGEYCRGPKAAAQFSCKDKDELETAHGLSFYEILCRRCCLPDREHYNHEYYCDKHCICDAKHESLRFAIVKLTMVRIFDPVADGEGDGKHPISFYLPLATEMEAKVLPTLEQRLVPKYPEDVQRYLKIFCPQTIIPKSKAGLLDHPKLRKSFQLMSGAQSPWQPPTPPESLFLNLPLDIINLVMEYLTPCERLTLSLTTKRLRHLTPAFCLHGSPGFIYDYLLSPQVHAPTPAGRCSYCAKPLCPPTCPTALFLDYKTGIFYPASLYPVHRAVPAPTEGFDKTSRCRQNFVPSENPPAWDNSPMGQNTAAFLLPHPCYAEKNPTPAVYKTIWCEHHRCPPSLMSDNYNRENAPMGSYRFHGDYYSNGMWPAVRKGFPKSGAWTPPIPARPEKIEWTALLIPKETDPEPFFYDQLCRHCYLPISSSELSDTVWSGRICKCWIPSKSSLKGKEVPSYPQSCECTIPVMFTLIEAFIPSTVYGSRVPFYLVLASEINAISHKTASRKMKPIVVRRNLVQYQRSLGIIRFGRVNNYFT
ncbi:hypothetical protein TWF281_010459 [Arthrobotrys megalospora]